jgi:hypothetical protein
VPCPIHPDAPDLAECHGCRLFVTDDKYNRAWGGPGVTDMRPRPPCRHLGPATGTTVACPPCAGRTQLKLSACAVHGSCLPQSRAPGSVSCPCPAYDPATFRMVAPLGAQGSPGAWEGRGARRPWHYRVTAVVPHLDTLDLLGTCLDLVRAQTEQPYTVVVDTGSPPDVCRELEGWRADDLEVHFVRGNGYTHSSEPVAVALDLGFARCNTEYLFLTHADVFLRRQDSIAWLIDQCSSASPVVGYEMSERSWATDAWRGMVSHTFTALHAETVIRRGLTWHMQRGRWMLGLGRDYNANGWPDTETAFNMALREAGIEPRVLGPEPNFARQRNEWFDHVRSLPGLKAYCAGSLAHRRAEADGALALTEARSRFRAWRGT